ncbi:potassium transporter [Lysinibacillus xylanilyticus]|uniref:potassium transporter n=1 Tax=Lysinibacillus xylanilyticus TaxID=582475 RepID=UPI002B24BA7B|nr:potassium transporter [Lysinibacillus xylanilyticus]MEB2278401.1 potassium transporter [Lysinibacillus xylanilyticus]
MTSSKNSTILILTALIAAILFALYYYIVTPKLEEVDAKESSNIALQQEVSTIKEQIALIEKNGKSNRTSNLTLRKKVPQTRAIDEVIRNIEEIEVVTGTRVEGMDFNNYDSLVMESTITDPNSTNSEEQADTQQSATEADEQAVAKNDETPEVKDKIPTATLNKDSLPKELKLVTFDIEVVALDNKAMVEFIKEIEKIDRVMKIDAIDFTLTGEETKFQEDADTTLKATVQVTTFYYEGQQ